MADETLVAIRTDHDLVVAREKGRTLASELGLSSTETTLVVTAISELVRNILRYAKKGEVALSIVEDGHKWGLLVEARDRGPGIPDVDQAMQMGYSTSGGLGLGLPGVRRLMDEFQILSEVGKGTTVRATKWKP